MRMRSEDGNGERDSGRAAAVVGHVPVAVAAAVYADRMAGDAGR